MKNEENKISHACAVLSHRCVKSGGMGVDCNAMKGAEDQRQKL